MNKNWKDSIVLIVSSDKDNNRFGTGFVIGRDDKNTYILTCDHVIKDVGGPDYIIISGFKCIVLASGEKEGIDLSVILVEGLIKKPVIEMQLNSNEGINFITAGFQLFGKQYLLRPIRGLLGSQVGLESSQKHNRFIAWDIIITDDYYLQPGYSGSPVIDESSGNAIGIISHRVGDGKKGLAISLDALSKICPDKILEIFDKPSKVDLSEKLIKTRVYISYAREDAEIAHKLYHDLYTVINLEPWLDAINILPGQNREITIRNAIKNSSYFIALLSSNSISKAGFVQKELKIALDQLSYLPSTEIFLIPVRIDECEIGDERLQELHWVDLFPSYKNGLKKIFYALGHKSDDQLKNKHIPRNKDDYSTGFFPSYGDQHIKFSEIIDYLPDLNTIIFNEEQSVELPAIVDLLPTQTTLVLNKENIADLEIIIDKLSNLKTLILSGLNLEEIPETILNISGLKELDISNNQLRELPTKISKIEKLEKLDAKGNKLKNLPDSLCFLSKLNSLILSSNSFIQIPKVIGDITSLKELDISNNQIKNTNNILSKTINLVRLSLNNNQLSELSSDTLLLNKLEILDLENNNISDLPHDVYKLNNLRKIDIQNNQISKLPVEINKLTKLTDLLAGNNIINELPHNITSLTELRVIELENNKITRLPVDIEKLNKLIILNIKNNRINEIPDGICKLSKLQRLDLSNNNINKLPVHLDHLINLKELFLEDNSLNIPPEILEDFDKPFEIITYYQRNISNLNNTEKLNEAKVVIVGQPSVGKTSLVKRLIKNEFDVNEPITRGIDIQRWYVDIFDENIRLNIWDFGGQEIMHATHQFFLTKRSLYLLVLDSRLDEQNNRLDYWLKIIQSYGEDSPILIVCNKCDIRNIELDWNGIQKKYPSIKSFAKIVSCKTGAGIDDLKAKIIEEISVLEHINDKIAANWLSIKNALENMRNNYISYIQYQDICVNMFVTDETSQRTILSFLHDLGTVLHFRGHYVLEDTNVLNPEWVTKAIYQILNSHKLFQNKGILEVNDLSEILDKKIYPKNMHSFIIEIMRKFELCFELDRYPGRWLMIPDLLQKETPYTGEWDDCLSFQYSYDVLPNSVISRFIVRMHAFIFKDTYWRYGVVLNSRDNQNISLVHADIENKKINIFVKGKYRSRRRFLEIIRSDFYRIHQTIPNLKVSDKIPIPNRTDITVDFNHLLFLERKGVDTIWPEGLKEPVNVKSLLDGIESQEMRTSIQKGDTKFGQENKNSSKKENEISLLKPIRILHLSDLHISVSTDTKAIIQPLLADINDKVDGLSINEIDCIVITGDITNKGDKDEFSKAYEFLVDLKEYFSVNDNCFIVVPGNHDINWDEDVYDWVIKRKTDISDIKQGTFIEQGNGLLIRDEERYPKRFNNFSKYFYKPLTGKDYPLNYEDQIIPYFCSEKNILFLAINSSWEIDEYFNNRSSIHAGALSRGLLKSDMIIKDKLENEIIPRSDNVFKIALWHHPVTGNEKIENDAFLERLRQAGFNICLHGHVHEQRSDIIGYLHPTRKLHIIGAGTFNASAINRPESIPRLYNLIELPNDKNMIRVHTRCMMRSTGAWESWAVWPGKNKLEKKAYYEINFN